MKTVKRIGLCSSIALVAGFAMASNALATQNAPVSPAILTAQGPAVATDYIWNGHHYAYVWHHKYFNHRRWQNNTWVYY